MAYLCTWIEVVIPYPVLRGDNVHYFANTPLLGEKHWLATEGGFILRCRWKSDIVIDTFSLKINIAVFSTDIYKRRMGGYCQPNSSTGI